ncbi:MAG: hypothetical protein NTZ05_22915 [Chloroflexi bacterium]|nr:hypothetical protein [Chloroflexota bacterium]
MERSVLLRWPWLAPGQRAILTPDGAAPAVRRMPPHRRRSAPRRSALRRLFRAVWGTIRWSAALVARVRSVRIPLRWLAVVVLAALAAATVAAAPLVREAAAGVPAIAVDTPALAVAVGLGSGRVVELAAAVDESRVVRSPRRGGAVYYAPVAGSELLVRTDDLDRLRQRPTVLTGRVIPLRESLDDPRLRAALTDGRGRPVSPDTPVLTEVNIIGDALLAAAALLVAWTSALSGLLLMRGQSAAVAVPAPALKELGPVRRSLRAEQRDRSA